MSLKDVYVGRSNSIEIVTEDISNSTIGFTIILFFLLSAFLILYDIRINNSTTHLKFKTITNIFKVDISVQNINKKIN